MRITEVHANGSYLSVRYKSHRILIPTSLYLNATHPHLNKKDGTLVVCDAWHITFIEFKNKHFYKLGKQLARM